MGQSIYLNSGSDLGQARFRNLPHSTRVLLEPGVNGTLESVIKQVFKNQLDVQDDFSFECLWKQALANRAISWSGRKILDLGTLRAIEGALQASKVFHGEGIAASTDPIHANGEVNKLHALTQYLLGRNELPNGMTAEQALAIFYEETARDPEGTCRLFTQELRELFLRARGDAFPQPGTARGKLFHMFIGHVIAAIPFVYPKPTEDTFPIPVIINGQWEMCEYKIERIELTPGPFSPLLAFGLTAPDRVDAPPILTLSGTTWGEGRFVSILSDLTPFMSVGHAPYLFGKSKIDAWISRQHKPVHLYGTSLGGALCFHVLRNHGNHISNVDVYNPPGLYSYLWKGPIDGPEVNIYVQKNDIASNVGYFPTGSNVHVYRVVGEKLDGWREAHGRAYGGGTKVTMINSSPAYENSRYFRRAWTALCFVAGLTIGAALWTFYLLTCFFHALKVKTYELIQCCRCKWLKSSPQPVPILSTF